MRADHLSEEDATARADVIARGCVSPFKTPSGVWVRCQTRVKSRCASCAELYRGDWAAIGRSGVEDAPVEQYRFYFLTLTAPSFGYVHRVPREAEQKVNRCRCGALHTIADAGMRGVPLDAATYDYAGQVAWNRDAGALWTNTVRRLRDRWTSVDFFIVREWQDRGVLHLHALVRIARVNAPTKDALRDAARSATAVSKLDGSVVEWGTLADCQDMHMGEDARRRIWYVSKALNYVLKDVAAGDDTPPVAVWQHQAALHDAARQMRCAADCVPSECVRRIHRNFGSRSHVVSASRRTKNRPGWSFSGLTRTVQRRLRREWFEQHAAATMPASAEPVPEPLTVIERLAENERRSMVARAAAVP